MDLQWLDKLVNVHCSCVYVCVSPHRCCCRGVQCILLLTGVSGKSISCACWEGWVSVSVVKENIWESSLLCVITGYRGDAFLHQEAEVSGEPRIQFQGVVYSVSVFSVGWEWDKGGIGMRVTFSLSCVCVCVGDHQTCGNGESKSVQCTHVHHFFSRLVNSSILWVEFTHTWKNWSIQWRPFYIITLYVQYFQEANLAYSSKKEQAELLQKVQHTLSSDCWLGHSSFALCAGVGCLRRWRWWGRSGSHDIQTTGTSSTMFPCHFPSLLLYPPPPPLPPSHGSFLFLSFTSRLASFLLSSLPSFATY